MTTDPDFKVTAFLKSIISKRVGPMDNVSIEVEYRKTQKDKVTVSH